MYFFLLLFWRVLPLPKRCLVISPTPFLDGPFYKKGIGMNGRIKINHTNTTCDTYGVLFIFKNINKKNLKKETNSLLSLSLYRKKYVEF
jgi:hypothetical protein